MNEFLEFILFGFGIVGISVAIAIGIIVSAQFLSITYFDNVPIIATYNGTVIYSGSSGCIDVASSGDTTQIGIKGGWLCFFPQAYYVGDDITIIGLKEVEK